MKQGDIVIINFPFTSLEKSKVRPALVISNEKFNKGVNIILLAISTQKGNKRYCESLEQDDLNSGKLLKESYVRLSNILSLEKKLILKKVGTIKKSKVETVIRKFVNFFD